jgi:hypothetical protein
VAVGSGVPIAVLVVTALGEACESTAVNPSLPQTSEASRAADPFVRSLGGTDRPERSVEVPSPTCGLEGRIVLEVRGEERAVRISDRATGNDAADERPAGEHGPGRSGPSEVRTTRPGGTEARNLAKRIALRAARPQWERTHGRPIAEEPAYRGREFTSSGRLLGHPIDAELGFELRVLPPEPVEGVRVRVEVAELTVTAHRYRTSWGKVKTIEGQPVEVGYFPPQTLVESSGSTAGPCVFRSAHEMQGRIRPGRKDVVRLAGFAFGMACRYRIVVEGFGKGPETPVQLASRLPRSAPLPAEGGSSRPAKTALLTSAPSLVPR